jgi:hypothetical protein
MPASCIPFQILNFDIKFPLQDAIVLVPIGFLNLKAVLICNPYMSSQVSLLSIAFASESLPFPGRYSPLVSLPL